MRQVGRRLFLILSLLVTALGTGLATAFAGVALYFLITAGPQRVRQEFSGEIAAARRAAGEKPPTLPLLVFIGGLGLGFPLGMGLWRRAVRATGRFDDGEIAAVWRL